MCYAQENAKQRKKGSFLERFEIGLDRTNGSAWVRCDRV